MRTNTITPRPADSSMKEWTDHINHLVDEVSSWADGKQDWSQERFPETRTENTGTYEFPVLVIHTPGGDLTLEPVPRREKGAKVRAYLSAWPTMNRVRLLKDGANGHWEIITDSGIPLRQPWNQKTFETLTQDLFSTL